MRVVAELARRAAAHPEAIALVGARGQVDYATLARGVDVLARWLRERKVARAGLWGENSIAWIVADLAAAAAGTVLVPIPPFFSPDQRAHVVAHAGLQHVLSVADDPFDGRRESTPLPGLELLTLAAPRHLPPVPDGTLKITFTSGTTGAPKGVCLTVAMLDAVTAALASRMHGAPGLGDALQRHFVLLPLATLLENIAGVHVPLLLGKHVVVRDGESVGLRGSSGLDAPALVRALQRDRPHSLILLPQILAALVHVAEQGLALPDSLRFVGVGGARTPASLLDRAQALGLPVFEGYGLSECASVVALNAPGAHRPGSVGRVLDHVQVRIDDGAIRIAGNVFPGYLGEPPRASGEWLDSGDLGHLDADGYLYVTGRRKNLIITGYGRNVSPEWVESELAACPGLLQSAVFGDGEAFLSAVVVAAPGTDPAELARGIAAVNRGLPDYARVQRFVLADRPFAAADGLLTENGRPRRERIQARYAGALAALHAASPPLRTGPVHEVL